MSFEVERQSVKYCAIATEGPAFVAKKPDIARVDKNQWRRPLHLLDPNHLVQERTQFLDQAALQAFNKLVMGADSCRACFAYAWQYHLVDKVTKAKYQKCTFDSEQLNAACVWVHNAGIEPSMMSGIVGLTNKDRGPHIFTAGRVCQRQPTIQQESGKVELPRICPTFMNDASSINSVLGITRCVKSRGLAWSSAGDRLCVVFGETLTELFDFVSNPPPLQG